MPHSLKQLLLHQQQLSQCQQCPEMQGPAVYGQAVISPVMLIGQAPGFKEIEVHKPFAWTAGKTLFGWFNQIGIAEEDVRNKVYMSAICRCFPGKFQNGVRLKTGDRLPSKEEISNCSHWLSAELKIQQPELIIPVGKLAIANFLSFNKLSEVIGRSHAITLNGNSCNLIPLPHPSGASTWPGTEPGKTLLNTALSLIEQDPAWQRCLT